LKYNYAAAAVVGLTAVTNGYKNQSLRHMKLRNNFEIR